MISLRLVTLDPAGGGGGGGDLSTNPLDYDDFADAGEISGGTDSATFPTGLKDATIEEDEPMPDATGTIFQSIWLKWVAGDDGEAEMGTAGSELVFTGTDVWAASTLYSSLAQLGVGSPPSIWTARSRYGTSGSSEPTWNPSGLTSDNEVSWYVSLNTTSFSWLSAHAYSGFQLIVRAGKVMSLAGNGTSGLSEPDWAAHGYTENVTDGTCTWQVVGTYLGSWLADHDYQVYDYNIGADGFYYVTPTTPDGFIYQMFDSSRSSGMSGLVEPDFESSAPLLFDNDLIWGRFGTAPFVADTVMAVYTGLTIDALTEVTSNDDNIEVTSLVVWEAEAGTTYWIQIGMLADITTNGPDWDVNLVVSWTLPGGDLDPPPPDWMLRVDGSAGDAYLSIDIDPTQTGEPGTDWWFTAEVLIPAASLAEIIAEGGGWIISTGPYGDVVFPFGPGDALDLCGIMSGTWATGPASGDVPDTPDVWMTLELHHVEGDTCEFIIDGGTPIVAQTVGDGPVRYIHLGLTSSFSVTPSEIFVRRIRLGSTRGGTEFRDDSFASGSLDGYIDSDSPTGDVSVVDGTEFGLGLVLGLGPLTVSGNVLRAVGDSWVEIDLGSDQTEVWVGGSIYLSSAALAAWLGGPSGDFFGVWEAGHAGLTDAVQLQSDGEWFSGTAGGSGVPATAGWHTFKLRHVSSGPCELHIDGVMILSGTDGDGRDTRFVTIGFWDSSLEPTDIVYFDDITVGTTEDASDLFADGFATDLSAWTSTSGDVTVVPDPDVPSPPPIVGGLLGSDLTASTEGLNDWRGFQTGSFETRLYQEGGFALLFPNVAGSDGILHRERFQITKPLEPGDTAYRPGHEYFEIYDGEDLLYVGTPLRYTIDRANYRLEGSDAFFLLQKNRETLSGYWLHSPRDVWEYYTRVWDEILAEDFAGGLPASSRIVASANVGDSPSPSAVRIEPTDPDSVDYVRGAHDMSALEIGLAADDPYAAWKVHATISRNRFGSETVAPFGDNAYVRIGVRTTDGEDLIYLELREKYSYVRFPDDTPGATDPARKDALFSSDPPGPYDIIVEGRERWVYFYFNMGLVAVVPMPFDANLVVPFVSVRSGDSTSGQWADVDNLSFGRSVPFLMRDPDRKGDYHLPGAPAPGGLWAEYFNDEGIHSDGNYAMLAFNPQHYDDGFYHQRVDKKLDFSGTWWPQEGAPAKGLWWSARWAGSVYLALADDDVLLGYTTLEEGARMWVGKTRRGEEYIDNWLIGLGGAQYGASLRDHLWPDGEPAGGYVNGWYPILIEYGQRGSVGAEFHLHYDDDTIVPTDKLSPYGIFHEQLRSESHYEALRAIQDSFGYQGAMIPQAAESGFFPGLLLPLGRFGRDTDKILTGADAETIQVTGDASVTADRIIGDGSGLALTEGAGDLSVEMSVYGEQIENEPFVQSEYEQFAEITYPPLMAQRLQSLLALRQTPWEEVTAVPHGDRDLADSFPIGGDLALFDWRAGDAMRLNFPELGIVDVAPRQLMGVIRPFVAVGLQAPEVTFRQRPRSFQESLRRLWRRASAVRKNYQGQVVQATGTPAVGPAGPSTTLPNVSRVALPRDLRKVVRIPVTVFKKPDSDEPWYLYVNGELTTMAPVTQTGVYEVSAYASHARDDDGGALPYMDVEFRL